MKKSIRLLTGLIYLGSGLAGTATAVYEVGDTIQDFTLTDLTGVEVAFYDHLEQIILLNFFTTWCPGCNEEAASLESDIWQVYQEQGVTIISVDIQEQLPLVQGWAAANGVTYHIWLTPDWTLFQQFEEFGAIPYNTVIDRNMILRYKQVGFDLSSILKMIATILDEDDITPNPIETWGGVKTLFR